MQTFVLLSSTTISLAICLFIFFLTGHRSGIAFAQLTASQETCDSDESVDVAGLPYTKCFDCTCKNGFVECVKNKCPDIEGCYVLQDLQEDDCCQKCKGCTKNGVYHESGTEWTESKNPCKLFTCKAGVITESTIRCYIPCNNPIPPKPGQCCSTCSNCNVNGKKVMGEKFIMSKKDPCVSCNCSSGTLTCMKKVCPVLNCPDSKIVHGFEECCPQCLGTGRYTAPPKGACLLGTTVHKSGTKFTLDKCTQCSCDNSTIHCEKKNCPILECKLERQKLLPDKCCPQCIEADYEIKDEKNFNKLQDDEDEEESEEVKHNVKHERTCIYLDDTYRNGDSWNTSTCETCTCTNGKIKCTPILCPAIKCPSNLTLRIPEGHCCPVCEGNQGICTVFGGAHFRTFDGKMYAFIGSCKYQLASDCDSGKFNIRLKNTVVGNDATIKRISIKLENIKIDLQQNKNTKVNDDIIDLPYRLNNKLHIEEKNDNVMITTEIGIKIHWNYLGFFEITVQKGYRKKLCGLCGNFNTIADDDMTTREGIIVDDPSIFAQSWTAGDDDCLDTRKYGIRGCNPDKDKRLCNYIKGSVFEKCLKKINVTSYYETCLRNMCECPVDDLQCYCESFASYVRDCRRLGITLPRWRKSVGC